MVSPLIAFWAQRDFTGTLVGDACVRVYAEADVVYEGLIGEASVSILAAGSFDATFLGEASVLVGGSGDLIHTLVGEASVSVSGSATFNIALEGDASVSVAGEADLTLTLVGEASVSVAASGMLSSDNLMGEATISLAGAGALVHNLKGDAYASVSAEAKVTQGLVGEGVIVPDTEAVLALLLTGESTVTFYPEANMTQGMYGDIVVSVSGEGDLTIHTMDGDATFTLDGEGIVATSTLSGESIFDLSAEGVLDEGSGTDPVFEGFNETTELNQMTLATDATPADGDLLVLVMHMNAHGGADPTPTGFTERIDDEFTVNFQTRRLWVYTREWNTGDPTTFTITPSRHAGIYRYSGANTSDPIQGWAANNESKTCPVLNVTSVCQILRMYGAGNDYNNITIASGSTIGAYNWSLSGADDTGASATDDATSDTQAPTRVWSGPSVANLSRSYTVAIQGT